MNKILENKILKNCIIFSLIYFLFSMSIDFTDTFKIAFIVLMQFLPGLTFPISTTYYKKIQISNVKIIAHVILSISVYYANVWLYSYEGSFDLSPIFAGFFGSFFYLVISKYLLKIILNWKIIIVVAIISGIGFIPNILLKGNGTSIGFAILIWTLINGALIFDAQKRTLRA
jgi:hypothetical protein